MLQKGFGHLALAAGGIFALAAARSLSPRATPSTLTRETLAASFASDLRRVVYEWDAADPRPEAVRRQALFDSCTKPTTRRRGFRSRCSTAT